MADPYWYDVSLLIDGTQGALTDLSSYGHSLSTVGTAAIVGSGGTGYLSLPALGDALQVAEHAAFGFGTGDFTFEAWVYVTSSGPVWDTTRSTDSSSDANITGAIDLYGVSAIGGDLNVDDYIGTFPLNVWRHVAWTRSGGTLRGFIGGAQNWETSFSGSFGASRPLTLGTSPFRGWTFRGRYRHVRVTKGVARYTAPFTPPAGPFEYETVSGVSIRLSMPSPLRQPAVVMDSANSAAVALPSPLGSPAIFASLNRRARAAIPSPLEHAALLLQHDFTAHLDPSAPSRWVMDLSTAGGPVRVPISSWQATLQTSTACYVQCVVPSCIPWLASIGQATAIGISRVGRLRTGEPVEVLMAQAPLTDTTTDVGGSNATATLSGYTPAMLGVADPPAAFDRVLTGARTTSAASSGAVRVRCDVDWLLRPGHRAYINGTPLVVDYINYYVAQGEESMFVGAASGL